MKKIKHNILFLLLVAISFVSSHARSTTLWLPFDRLGPTQMNIGILAMKSKVKKILDKDMNGELYKYLKKKVAPAYLAKNGKYYIIDRHHTSRALYESNTSFRKFPVKVIADYSNLTMNEFFREMNKRGYLYLKENGKGPVDPFQLPWHIKDITNDPYRSLAWMVREEGGFKKVDVPFLEFMWGDFFRKYIRIQNNNEQDLKKYLKKAMYLAKSDRAKHLPGFCK